MRHLVTAALAVALLVPGIAAAGIGQAGIEGHARVDRGDAIVDGADPDLIRSIRGRAIAGITMTTFAFLTSIAGIVTSPMLLDDPMLPPALALYAVAAPFAWGARSAALGAQGLPGMDGHVKASIAGYAGMMASGTAVATPLGRMMPSMRTVFWANLSGNAAASLIMSATALAQSRRIASRGEVASSIVPFAAGTAGHLIVGVTGSF